MSVAGEEASPDQREQLLNALYNSMPEIPAWKSFLSTASSIFRCDNVSLMIGIPIDGQSEPLGVHHDAAFAMALDGFCRTGEAATMLESRATQATLSVSDGPLLALLVSVADAMGRTATLILVRRGDDRPFSARDALLLEGLAEPLRRALNIYYRLVHLERRQHVFNAALETSRIGIILIDRDGAVLFTNSIADTLIEPGNCLRLVHGKLRAGTPTETAELMAHVRRQADEQTARPNWNIYAPMALSKSGSILPLTVIVRPGPAFFPLEKPLKRTAMLILRDPDRQPLIPATTLARLFGLTPAESQLASELAAGSSLEEAAANIGISRNTVRSQLQSIFHKTGTNRQGDLVRILLSSAATAS